MNAHCALFQSNSAGYGGALLNASGGTTTISGSKFEGNAATAQPPENFGADIFNLSGTVTATHNEWVDGPKVNNDPDASEVSTQPTATFDASGACASRPPSPPCSGTVSEDAVVRAEPSTESATVGGAPAGSGVKLYYKHFNDVPEVWYFVQYADGRGWIRSDLIVASSPESCSVPWDIPPDCLGGEFISQTDTCNYPFDRDRATQYGAAFATCPNLHVNSETGNPYFCTYHYGGYHTGCGGGSDCANFVSQALFYGGMPMNADWYCTGTPCGSENENNWTAAIRENFPAYIQDLGGVTFTAPKDPRYYISPYFWGLNTPYDENSDEAKAIRAFTETMSGNTSLPCSERDDGIVAGDVSWVTSTVRLK